MRIDKIELENFRGFEHFEMNLHPQFTLLVGENGSGKTSVLNGLAVALRYWHLSLDLDESGFSRFDHDIIRLEATPSGDRTTFERQSPCEIVVMANIGDQAIGWSVRIFAEGSSEFGGDPHTETVQVISDLRKRPGVALPVITHYGSKRLGDIPLRLPAPSSATFKPSRWDAYDRSLNGKVSLESVRKWIILESAARDPEGRFRPGFETVRIALQQCIPGVEKVWFDHDFLELAVRIEGQDRLFSTLSDGQLGMAAMVADMAIRAVTLNSHLLPAKLEKGKEDSARRVLAETPGVVLIDELDLHLHPKWQRSVAADLMRTFPKVQFVATSHSPQIIGELKPEMVMLLEDNQAYPAPRSIGLDSNRVLEELMGAEVRNKGIAEKISEIARLIDDEELNEAKQKIVELAKRVGEDDPEITHANTMIHFLEDEAVHEND